MENTEKKARVLSAIQPTSVPTLGNYLGALKNWKSMSKDNDCLYAVADLHAITVRQEPAMLSSGSRPIARSRAYISSVCLRSFAGS